MNSWHLLRAIVLLRSRTALTYRLDLPGSAIAILISCLMFYGIDRIGFAPSSSLPGDYFAFVLVGLATNGLLLGLLHQSAMAASQAEQEGVLAFLWLSGRPTLPHYLLLSLLPAAALRIGELLLFALIGALFGARLPLADWPTAGVVLLLSLWMFAAFGLISAAAQLWLKRHNPLQTLLFGGVAAVLAGTYFPVAVLPESLQLISRLLPITYTLEGLRAALLTGGDWHDPSVRLALAAIAAAALLFSLCGLWLLRLAEERVRREGSLRLFD